MSKVAAEIKKAFGSLDSPFSILLVVSPEVYSETMVETVSFLTKAKKMSGVYLTINKISSKCIEDFKKAKIETKNIYFIDAISKMANSGVSDTENIKYVQSPNSLTELSIAATTVLQKEKDKRVFVFDSISTLLAYNKPEVVSRFMHVFSSKISMSKTSAVFVAIKGETDSSVQSTVGQFVDKTINID